MSPWRRAISASCLGLVFAAAPAAAQSGEAIAIAARDGDRAAVRRLLQRGTDPGARQADGTTALHWAVRADDLELARLLLAAGAHADVVNRYGVTPLSLAASNGHAPMLRLLLERGATVKSADAAVPGGRTLLMLAARAGRVDALRLLVEHGADVHAREPRTGTTALMWAAVENRGDAVRYLAGAGADINARAALTQYPHTPPAVVGDALEPGVSYVGQTVLPKGGWTALMYAARQGALQAARALADAGADLDVRDPDGTSALLFAIINAHYDVASMLVQKGANPNLADNAGMTPLYAAVDMHTLASTFGRPDLPPAAVAGSVDAVRMLLAAGADPNARLSSRILKRVYNAGDAKLGEGATPFMRAARGGDVAVMRLLLAAGADPAVTQKNGNTPMLLAASLASERDANNPLRGGEAEALAALEICLQQGLDVNAVSAAGDSVIHVALGSPTVIRFLARHGARLDVRNKQGRTPLEAALRAREPNGETIAVLRELTGDHTTTAPATPAAAGN